MFYTFTEYFKISFSGFGLFMNKVNSIDLTEKDKQVDLMH